MDPRITEAFAAIDAANAADPTGAALAYGRNMTAEQEALHPDASAALRVACRGQHVERWRLPRADFPEGREGYLAWRREQARRHAERVGGIMREAGFSDEDAEAAGRMIRKEGIKRDPQVQALEDVACFCFLRHEAATFLDGRDDALRIVARTARKMSPEARTRALAEFALPDALAAAIRDPDAALDG